MPAEPAPALAVLAAVAAGGALGAGLRYGLTQWAALGPASAAGLGQAWLVLGINAVGSFLMGVLVVRLLRPGTPPLVRPFLGTGVLGGFTTFSAFAIDVRALFVDGAPWPAGCYLLLTPALAIAACWLGVEVMRRAQGGRLPAAPESGDL